MDWYNCCDYIREHGIVSDEGKSHWRKEDLLNENSKDDYDEEAYYWVLAFLKHILG